MTKPTIEWLASAGYISYDNYDGEYFDGVTLTAKGLETIRSDKSMAEQLIAAAQDVTKSELKNIAREKIRQIMSDMLAKGIKYGWGYIIN
ncbi:MAG: hypothetical protein G8D91_12020 [gamma proteobacterium symbiont of Clathrolucina costata]